MAGGDKKLKKAHSSGRLKRSRSRSPTNVARHGSGKSSGTRGNFGGEHHRNNDDNRKRRSKFD